MNAPIVRTYSQRIETSPQAVFPLICPVREGEWLDGWAESCELIWSSSGLAEAGCVFRTTEPGLPETIWAITRHEAERGVVQFVRVTAGLVACTLDVAISEAGDCTSDVAIRYTVTPTSPAGERFAEARFEPSAFESAMAWWERSMNHFLHTGSLLRVGGAADQPGVPNVRDEVPRH